MSPHLCSIVNSFCWDAGRSPTTKFTVGKIAVNMFLVSIPLVNGDFTSPLILPIVDHRESLGRPRRGSSTLRGNMKGGSDMDETKQCNFGIRKCPLGHTQVTALTLSFVFQALYEF